MIMQIDKKLSSKMANMGLFCAVTIVLHHVNLSFPKDSLGWYWNSGVWGVPFAVPYFFLAAGFFLAGHIDEPGWWISELAKRVKTLLIPFLIWNGIFLFYHVGVLVTLNFLAHRPILANVWLSPSRILNVLGLNLFGQPEAGHSWFIRSLFLFVLVSPLLKKCLSKRFLFILLFLYLGLCPDNESAVGWRCVFRWFFSVEGLFYFSVGMFLRYRNISFNYSKFLSLVFLIFGFVAFLIAKVYLFFPEYFRVSGSMCVLVGLWGIMPTGMWPKYLTAMAFPLYMIHPIMLFVPRIFASHIHWLSFLTTTFVGWWLVALWGVGVSLISARLLMRLVPRFSTWAFGNRAK